MRINNNMLAVNTHRQLGLGQAAGSKSMEKLSSGLRINRAGDDAAGLSISEKMRAQIRGLNQASRNSQDGISMIQTAEGALNETHAILQRMRELADQSANGTNTDSDRDAIQNEIGQLRSEIDRIGDTTEFNTQKLLNGNLQSSGSVEGLNSTTGSAVAKLTGGKLTSVAMGSTDAQITDAEIIDEKIMIDGTEITVKWSNLSADEKTTLKYQGTDAQARKDMMELVVNKINAAIDESGANVEHVTGYVDTNGKLVLETGSKGTKADIELKTTSAVLTQLSATDGTTTSANLVVTAGTSNYNGTATNGVVNFEINGVALATSDAIVVANGETMATAAAAIQAELNQSITAYNTLQGKSATDDGYIQAVKVNVTDDGRFQIVSETGPIKLSDKDGLTVAKDLGLSEAQTDASGNGGMTFQIGANRGQTITFGIKDMRSQALGINSIDVGTQAGASAALTKVDSALQKVSEQRSALGAVQNRLEHTIKNLDTSAENLQAAESRIRDVDMAKEMMEFTKNNILSQAAQAMLAQANQAPQGVLQLLR